MLYLIKILLIDNRLLIRTGFKELLKPYSHIQILAECEDGDDCLRRLKTIRPDVIVLDIDLPKINGLEIVRRMTERKQTTACLILTNHIDEKYLTNAINAGCKGYLLKTATQEELLSAIETVANGKTYFHEKLPKRLLKLSTRLLKERTDKEMGIFPKLKSGRKRSTQLTLREIELMNLLGQGLRNIDIANQLFLSEKTVKNHLTNIYRKLGVKDRTQALLVGVREHWIILPTHEHKSN